MENWIALARIFTNLNPRQQNIIVAAAASLLTTVSIYSMSSISQRMKIRYLKSEIKVINDWEQNIEQSESLIAEQLSRNQSFLGTEKLLKVRKSFVIVIGLGGVGSHAAHMLLRSGVEHM